MTAAISHMASATRVARVLRAMQVRGLYGEAAYYYALDAARDAADHGAIWTRDFWRSVADVMGAAGWLD